MARCLTIFGTNNYMLYIQPLWEHHIKMGDLDRISPTRFYYWDDASRVVGYLDYVYKRVHKYGMGSFI